MLTIGLTGGIGSGKSAASAILAELGAVVIDADKVGHEIYSPGTPVWDALVRTFGREILADDGTIDRKRLGAKVFSDSAALGRLNAIVHPRMAEEIGRRIAALRDRGRIAPVVVEAAVLIEAGWDRLVDEFWVITVAPELAIERVMSSRGLTRAEVERRMKNQIGDAERTRGAARVINNDGSREDLRSAIERAWSERVAPTLGR
ncbi:MAG: dephospho-CoA kinase [Candidatus Binatia bacterium]